MDMKDEDMNDIRWENGGIVWDKLPMMSTKNWGKSGGIDVA